MSVSQLTVVVRVRPLSATEKDKRHFQCVFQLDRQRLLLVDPERYENNILRQNRQHERQFSFDAAFGPSSTQEDVHTATTGPMIDSVIAGYNATVFAYGATGSGKTYTMIGTKDRPGVMSLLTRSLYEKISLEEYQVQLSYLNRGQRLKEGAAINRSLLALGNVINSLSSNTKGKYVNYRDSKLTRLLKDSLGGNARTCMIAHVTAASGHYEETYNTLVYASRAKNITNKLTMNRPASADQPYTDAMREIRREYERRAIPHASSSNHIDKSTPNERQYKGGVRWNNNTNTVNGGSRARRIEGIAGDRRDFSSLFNQLKEQYITLSDKQQKLRERLMKANQDSYEIDMSRASKLAIIGAWEKQHQADKSAESIDRLKKDVIELETRLSDLVDVRQKLEKALRKGQETSKAVENRLRTLATSKEQKELINLIVRMDCMQAEKISAVNDLAIQAMIMQKTDNSMSKLPKYEMLAEKLIEGRLDDKDREQLEQEYRIVKNQFHYHLIPLKNIQTVVSWNSMLLPKINSASATTDDIIRRTPNARKSKKRDSVQLPIIVKGREKERDSEGTDSYDGGSEPTPESPLSIHLPPLK